jgi:hypothetical protein
MNHTRSDSDRYMQADVYNALFHILVIVKRIASGCKQVGRTAAEHILVHGLLLLHPAACSV